MKLFSLILIFILLQNTSFSQDTIVKVSGEKMIVNIFEITETFLKYKKIEQPNGPLRSLYLGSIEKVIYKDGTEEIFDVKTTYRKIDTPLPKEDFMHKNGVFFDVLIGYGENKAYYEPYYIWPTQPPVLYRSKNITISFKVGNKLYFGNRKVWKPGVQFTWLRYNINVRENNFLEDIFIGKRNFSIANVGMANIFKFSEKFGVEANIVAGFNLEGDLDRNIATPGLNINPEFKLRFNEFAIGIDYSRIQTFTAEVKKSNWDILSLSIGFKM